MANFTTSGQVPSAEAAIYTAPAADTAVKTIIIANPSNGGAQTVTLKVGTLFLASYALAAGETLEFSPSFPLVLASGGTIRAVTTTATTVSFFISGVTP